MEMIENTAYKMLSGTTTQYLNPDYVQPLPTTLDAKSSPLALLAQTCSSIGRDTATSAKQTTNSSDKKEVKSSDSHTHSSTTSRTTSSRSKQDTPTSTKVTPKWSCDGAKGRDSERSRSSSADESASVTGNHGQSASQGHGQSGRSKHESRSPSSANSSGSSEGQSSRQHGHVTSRTHHTPHNTTSNNSNTNTNNNNNNNNNNNSLDAQYLSMMHDSGLVMRKECTDDLPASSALSVQHHFQRLHQESLAAAAAAYHSAAAAAAAGLANPGSAAALGVAGAGYPPLFLGAHPGLLVDPLIYSAALNAYSPKLPFTSAFGSRSYDSSHCKDPYCNSVSASPSGHAPPSGHGTSPTCSSVGCTQCPSGVDKGIMSSTGSSLSAVYSSLYPFSVHGSALGGSYAPLGLPGGHLSSSSSSLSSLSSSSGAYVCSWLFGGEFCGKRFQTSEDLLQHLRTTHTSVSSGTEPSTSPLSPATFASYHGISLPPGFPYSYPHLSATGSLSPGSQAGQGHSPYVPKSLSPASILSSAARYHPYKSPFAAPSSLLHGAMPPGGLGPPSALAAYYSNPYTLFSQRLSAAVVGP